MANFEKKIVDNFVYDRTRRKIHIFCGNSVLILLNQKKYCEFSRYLLKNTAISDRKASENLKFFQIKFPVTSPF